MSNTKMYLIKEIVNIVEIEITKYLPQCYSLFCVDRNFSEDNNN